MERIKLELRISKKLFYDTESMYGIFSCVPKELNSQTRVLLNSYGNMSIKGNTRELLQGQDYTIEIEGEYTDKQNRRYYKILEVETEDLSTNSGQDKFLKTVLATNHYLSLKKAYPDEPIVTLIMEDRIDVARTKGIKEATLAVIKKKVEDNYNISLLISKIGDLELSTNRIHKIKQHFGSSDVAVSMIEKNVYSLCEIGGFGFLTVDEAAMKRGDDPKSPFRIIACVEYLLKKDNQDGHTWSIKQDIYKKAEEYMNLSVDFIEEVIEKENKKSKELYIDEQRIAIKRLLDVEREIYINLKRIRDSYNPPNTEETVAHILKSIEKNQRFKYTDEQKEAIIEGSQHGVVIINGGGGVGKSTVVKGIVDCMNSLDYMACALSGKAVQVLHQRDIRSATIHRMLKYDPAFNNFSHNEANRLSNRKTIIDEMSMVNIHLTLSVLKAIESGSQLIIVGDNGQLSAIGSGDVLTDLLAVDKFKKFELTKVHRQAEKSGILQLASEIRQGKQIMPYGAKGKRAYGENGDQVVASFQDGLSILSNVIKISEQYTKKINKPEDLLDFQVITPTRESGELSVRNINNQLQKIFNDISKPALSKNGYDYREGDKIISDGNSYGCRVYDRVDEYYKEKIKEEAFFNEDLVDTGDGRETDVFNGTMGYVFHVDIDEKIVFLKFEGSEGLVVFTQEELENIQLAYAITVHKSQGSAFKYLLFAMNFSAYSLLSRQLLYTAVTRATDKSVLLVENNAMHRAIETDTSTLRQTFLQDIINGKL